MLFKPFLGQSLDTFTFGQANQPEKVHHRFHLVDESPWPLLRAFGGLFLTTGLVNWF